VHFACHASQNIGDPSASALILHDGPLTVLDMAGLQIPHGELAFLSACETAGGGAALPDESIHLAAALQAVGFRHVIATFWPVYDALAPSVTKAFYEGLARERTTANTGQLLHEAVRRLRARAPTPAAWAPYAHFGP
jgi:CHAT domain-containing protein